jgi:hypothetical protein
MIAIVGYITKLEIKIKILYMIIINYKLDNGWKLVQNIHEIK